MPLISAGLGTARIVPGAHADRAAADRSRNEAVAAARGPSDRGVRDTTVIASSPFNPPLVFAGRLVDAALRVSLCAISSFIERRVAGSRIRKSEAS